jgi:hypothetical protein
MGCGNGSKCDMCEKNTVHTTCSIIYGLDGSKKSVETFICKNKKCQCTQSHTRVLVSKEEAKANGTTSDDVYAEVRDVIHGR